MSWNTLLIYGLGGLTTSIASIAIGGIILLVLSQLMYLLYKRFYRQLTDNA